MRHLLRGIIARRLFWSFTGLAMLALLIIAGSILLVNYIETTLTRVEAQTNIAELSTTIRSESLQLLDMVRQYTFPVQAKLVDRADLEDDIAARQAILNAQPNGLIYELLDSIDPGNTEEREKAETVKQLLDGFVAQIDRVIASYKSENAFGPATYRQTAVLIEDHQTPLINAISDLEQFERARANTEQENVHESVRIIVIPALVLFALLAVIAASVMIWQGTNRIVVPLSALREGVERLQHGQLGRPVQVRGQDEMADLANAFNTMAAQLQKQIADQRAARQALEALNTELEQRVAQRTTDLEASQRELEEYGRNLANANAQLQNTFKQSERRAQLLEASATVARAAALVRDPEALLPQAMQLISQHFGYYHSGLFLLDDAHEWAILRAANSEGGQAMLARGHKLRVGAQGIVGWTAQTGQPRIALDVGADAVHFDNPFLPDTRSEMGLPLKIGERILGVLDVQSTQESAFSEEDIAVLESLADQLAIAIENARLFQQTQIALEEAQQAQQRYIMREWAGYLESGGTQAQEYASNPALMIGDAPLPELDFAHTEGHVVALNDLPSVLSQRPDTGALKTPKRRPKTSQQQIPPAQAALVAPIKLGDQVIGVLDLRETERTREWTEDEIALADAVATQVALAIENARLFEQTQMRVQQLAVLNEISRAASGLLESEQLLIAIYEQLRRVIRVDAFFVGLHDSESNIISYPVCYDAGQRYEETPGPLRPGSTIYKVITTGEPVYFQYTLEEFERLKLSTIEAMGSTQPSAALMYAPMKVGQQVLGVMSVQSYEFDVYTQEHLNLLSGIANQVAVAIQNTRLFEQTRARVQELAVLNEISRAASGLLESEQLLIMIYEQIQQIIDTDAYFVGLYDSTTNMIHFPVGFDLGQRYETFYTQMNTGSTMTDVVLTGEPVLTLRTREEIEQRVRTSKEESLLGTGRISASLMYVPLKIGERTIGVITVQSYEPNAYTQEHLNLLSAIANQVAVALENARLFEQTMQQVDDLEMINRVGQIITSAISQDQLLQLLHEQVSKICGTTNFYVARLTLDRSQVEFMFYYEDGRLQEIQSIPADQGLTSYIIKNNQPVLIRSQEELNTRNIPYVGRPCQSYLAVPMRAGERLSAVIAVQDYERERLFDERHLRILTNVATQAATAYENTRLFEEARRRALQLATAAETGKAASSLLDMNELLTNTVELIRIRFGYYHASVFLMDEANEYAVLQESTGDVGRVLKERGHKLAVGGQSLIGWVTKEGRSRVVTETSTDQIHFKNELLPNTRSELSIPLIRGDKIIGALDIQSTEPNAFTPEDVPVMELLADQIAIAIENARLYSAEQLRRQETAAMLEVARVVGESLEFKELMAKVAQKVAHAINVNRGTVFLLDETRTSLQPVAAQFASGKVDPELWEKFKEVQAERVEDVPLCQQAIRTGQPAIFDRDENPAGIPKHWYEPFDIHSALIVSLVSKGSPIGIMVLDYCEQRDSYRFTPEQITLAAAMAAQSAMVIDNARLYEELVQTAEQLREMDRLKSQFLASMSHELRTPLNSIIGFSRVILKGIDGPLTDMQKQDLEAIHGSGQHLLGLINDILDISKIEAGKMELSLEEVDMHSIVKGVMSTAIGLTKDKTINLIQKIPDDLPTVWADQVRARQVLLNLVSNAAKFTEKGSITVEAISDARFVRISVRDTGIGIPEEKLSIIFEAFTQADSSTTRKYGGTGLGLAISRRFIEMHGGEIWVESEIGAGTTFSFTLPRAHPEELAPSEEAQVDVTTGKKIVLAIDDEPGVITLYRRYLDQHGYHVIGVTKSEQALEQVRRFKPHAITLDILMPDKDGWAILQELKQDPETRDIPVILCSIISEQGRGFSMGASDYLVKPIMQNDLIATLKRLNGRAKTHVLVVDDSPEDIRLIRRMLESDPNFVVSEAHSGTQGLKAIQETMPDLVILDLMMPGMDGFEVLENLKADHATRDIPIVVVTAKDLTSEDMQRLNGYIQSLLSKGRFTEKDLLNDVVNVLTRLTSTQPEKEDQDKIEP